MTTSTVYNTTLISPLISVNTITSSTINISDDFIYIGTENSIININGNIKNVDIENLIVSDSLIELNTQL